MLDLEDFGILAHGHSDQWLCEHLGVTPRHLRNWKSGKTPVPKPVKLLLQFIHYGELSAIGGKDWEGFTLRGGCLSIPLFPRTFTAQQLGAMFFTTQDAWANRADLNAAQKEIARLSAELAQEKRRTRAAVEIRIDGETIYHNLT